ncbi:hypothetical protein ACFWPA_04035 [Rhodococcus sp. NPDC058505]|uniref:hypothetical protein n=1 Tax=unclassified Rhodococcus (in: high G+C Gram-positive bacteria) TaxID=192944 RepID=UPI0036632439
MTATDLPTDHLTAARRTEVRYGWRPRPALLLGAVVAALMLALNLLVATGSADLVPTPIRILVVLAGATLVPGLPVVVALRIPGRALFASLVVSVSLATTILAAQFTMVPQWWNPATVQTLLAAGSLLACVLVRRTVPADIACPRSELHYLRSWSRARTTSLVALTASIVLFAVAAATLDYLDAGRYGIITQIGVVYALGLVVLCGTIVAGLTRPRIDPVVMSAATLVLIGYTTMLVPAASGQTTVPTAFVHRGFIAALAQGERLPDAIDARFSWAGFFSAGAHLVTVADLPDATALLAWAPLFMGALLAFPLYAIAIAITGRARLAWLAVILYQLFNWYQQDYFAPQAVAMVFYATVIATLLWQLRRAPLPGIGPGVGRFLIDAPRRTPGLVPGFGSVRTLALGAVLLLVLVANTVTHQITPILAIIALAFFSLFGLTRYRTLWLAAGLVFAAWFSYGATDFWTGHLQSIFDELGQIGNSVNRGVGDRISGDPDYQQMQYLRMAASGLFACVAFVGWLLARGRRAWLVAGALCAAPFTLVLLQSYGGEMIIRCFVYASPVLAPFAAIAVARGITLIRRRSAVRARGARPVALVAGTVILVVLGVLLTTNRGLNTAFEASTTEQVAITDEFIAAVPPDTTIMSWSHAPHSSGVRRTLDPRGPRMMFIDSYPCLDDLANCARTRDPSYLYLTTQGTGMLRLQYGMSQRYLDDQVRAILSGGRYLPMLERESITILRRVDSPVIEFETS